MVIRELSIPTSGDPTYRTINRPELRFLIFLRQGRLSAHLLEFYVWSSLQDTPDGSLMHLEVVIVPYSIAGDRNEIPSLLAS